MKTSVIFTDMGVPDIQWDGRRIGQKRGGGGALLATPLSSCATLIWAPAAGRASVSTQVCEFCRGQRVVRMPIAQGFHPLQVSSVAGQCN